MATTLSPSASNWGAMIEAVLGDTPPRANTGFMALKAGPASAAGPAGSSGPAACPAGAPVPTRSPTSAMSAAGVKPAKCTVSKRCIW